VSKPRYFLLSFAAGRGWRGLDFLPALCAIFLALDLKSPLFAMRAVVPYIGISEPHMGQNLGFSFSEEEARREYLHSGLEHRLY
jgi:hypothetical protein